MGVTVLKNDSEIITSKEHPNSNNAFIYHIHDQAYDADTAQDICRKREKNPNSDIILVMEGTQNSIHYLAPFFYITYQDNESLDQLYYQLKQLRSDARHQACINVILESLSYNLFQGTNHSLIEKYISVLNLHVTSGGCILFAKHALCEAIKTKIHLYLFTVKQTVCVFQENKETCIAFLFSQQHLKRDDTKEIALFLHSLGIDKQDAGVSSVKDNLTQFHDAYVESWLDFENQPAHITSILLQDNAINYTLSLLSENMTRSLEERDLDSLHRNIEDYMEFLFQLKSTHRVEVTIKLLHQLYERFYLIKNAQPIRDQILEIETDHRITSELDIIYGVLQKILNEMMSMMTKKGIEKHALINDIYDYVKVNYRNTTGLKDVADTFHVTPQYICQLFSKYTSTSFSALLTYFRIYHAKLFLKNGLTIKEVADACGFHDVSYFMKKFKSVTGVTANEYKNSSAKY